MRVKLKIRGHTDPLKIPTVCAGCDSPIAPDATFCEICHAPIVRRYCAGCSKLIPENSRSCPYCGTSSKIKPRESNFGLSKIAILTIIGTIAAYFIMGGFFSGKESNVPQPAPTAPTAVVEAPSAIPPKKSVEPPKIHPVANQPVARSDEEGARLNFKGYQLIQQGDYVAAEEVLRRAVQSFPDDTRAPAYKYALYNLGHVLRRTGHAKEAIPYLQKAAVLDPEWSMAQTELKKAKDQAENSKVL